MLELILLIWVIIKVPVIVNKKRSHSEFSLLTEEVKLTKFIKEDKSFIIQFSKGSVNHYAKVKGMLAKEAADKDYEDIKSKIEKNENIKIYHKPQSNCDYTYTQIDNIDDGKIEAKMIVIISLYLIGYYFLALIEYLIGMI